MQLPLEVNDPAKQVWVDFFFFFRWSWLAGTSLRCGSVVSCVLISSRVLYETAEWRFGLISVPIWVEVQEDNSDTTQGRYLNWFYCRSVLGRKPENTELVASEWTTAHGSRFMIPIVHFNVASFNRSLCKLVLHASAKFDIFSPNSPNPCGDIEFNLPVMNFPSTLTCSHDTGLLSETKSSSSMKNKLTEYRKVGTDP